MIQELDDVQHQALHQQLLALKQDLQAHLDLNEESPEELVRGQSPTDAVARLNAVQEQAMIDANRKHYQDQLRGVLAALAAIEAGDYGFCQQCDAAIPVARLRIMPESLYCVACQTQRENH